MIYEKLTLLIVYMLEEREITASQNQIGKVMLTQIKIYSFQMFHKSLHQIENEIL